MEMCKKQKEKWKVEELTRERNTWCEEGLRWKEKESQKKTEVKKETEHEEEEFKMFKNQ